MSLSNKPGAATSDGSGTIIDMARVAVRATAIFDMTTMADICVFDIPPGQLPDTPAPSRPVLRPDRDQWQLNTIAILTSLRQDAGGNHLLRLALDVATQLAYNLCQSNEPADAWGSILAIVQHATGPSCCEAPLDNRPPIAAALSRAKRAGEPGEKASELPCCLDSLIARNHAHHASRRIPRPAIEPLSPREQTILQLIGGGKSNKEIARILEIAPETVKSHVKNLFVKLGVEKRAQAVARAQSAGFPYHEPIKCDHVDWLNAEPGLAQRRSSMSFNSDPAAEMGWSQLNASRSRLAASRSAVSVPSEKRL
jgi:DNA-binding CsgD family transcriptional regulator